MAEANRSEREDLTRWIAEQRAKSIQGLLRCISRTDLVKRRENFGQTIRPAAGSVLASPSLGNYDPEPDYFFHWVRDSALVMEVVGRLAAAGNSDADWQLHMIDFLAFTRRAGSQDGATLVADGTLDRVAPDSRRWARPAEELASVSGSRVAGDVRCNPDGTLDIKFWSRPQHDGPALRALTLLKWWGTPAFAGGTQRAELQAQILDDLDTVQARSHEPCFDLWEERLGEHYHTKLVQAAALEAGAAWADRLALGARATGYMSTAQRLMRELDAAWSPAAGCYRPRRATTPPDPTGYVDMAVVLAVVQSGRRTGRHSLLDDRVHATLERLEAIFAAEYPFNRRRDGPGLAYGRYPGDRYMCGGAYHMTTLAAAEFYYRLAEALGAGPPIPEPPTSGRRRIAASEALARADAIIHVVRAVTPASGRLSEQFDQTTGEPCSALDLGWSHAAFLTAADARTAALVRLS